MFNNLVQQTEQTHFHFSTSPAFRGTTTESPNV